jgi:N-acetylmuramoyl-L-alanine amidase
VPAPGWVDVRMALPERMPYLVREEGNTLVLTLYGVRMGPSLGRFLGNDSLVRHATWEQVTTDRAELRLHLSGPPFGYLALHERGQFTLRVRRPPAVNPLRPLEGITVAVDAGHPPAGATGPTGLYEGDAMLPVADRAAVLLRERGATVVRIRTTPEPFPLAQRPADARRADAHALVSLHLNALGDGVNPFRNHGSSVLYFHPRAEPLARALERALIAQFGLPDLGVHFQNIAIGRTTWMPSVITEGLFVMMPEQEAAMRTPEGQEQYARAVADGVEAYFRGLAR